MRGDAIDHVLRQWNSERPDLDSRPMAVVGRILRLAGHLEHHANEALKPFGIAIWAFDVLGTLRRAGEPFCMTPTELVRSVMLSSGAMTNRIDRLEQLGLVERKAAPDDRRSLQVALTAEGLRLIDSAAAVRFQDAKVVLRGVSMQEQKQLAQLLRKVLLTIENE